MRIAEVLGASTGGIGRHVASLAPRLAGLGHQVILYCPQSTVDAHDLAGLDVRPLSRLPGLRRADVVHAHGYQAGAAALPWTWGSRVPLVVSWHNAILAPGWRGLVGRALQRLVARGADLTLGASLDLVQVARTAGARDAELGPVAAPRLAPPTVPRDQVRADLGLAPGDVLVLSVARLAPQKNLGMVLDVAARLVDRPTLAFVVAGGGPLHDALAARVARDGSRVRLLGAVDDVSSLLSAADLMLLTSAWEARALVAQEALLAGLALVSTRVGGIQELVGDAAVLVGAGDVAAAAAAVVRLADDPARRAGLATAGRLRAAGWPDEDQIARDLATSYARLVSSARAGRSTRRLPPA